MTNVCEFDRIEIGDWVKTQVFREHRQGTIEEELSTFLVPSMSTLIFQVRLIGQSDIPQDTSSAEHENVGRCFYGQEIWGPTVFKKLNQFSSEPSIYQLYKVPKLGDALLQHTFIHRMSSRVMLHRTHLKEASFKDGRVSCLQHFTVSNKVQ